MLERRLSSCPIHSACRTCTAAFALLSMPVKILYRVMHFSFCLGSWNGMKLLSVESLNLRLTFRNPQGVTDYCLWKLKSYVNIRFTFSTHHTVVLYCALWYHCIAVWQPHTHLYGPSIYRVDVKSVRRRLRIP